MSDAAENPEPVLQIEDYLDRPLKGVANYRGVPHRFCSLGWTSPPPQVTQPEWDEWERAVLDNWSLEEDRYELTGVSGPCSPIWARASFTGAEPGDEVPSGGPSALRVVWRPITIQERIGRIFEAQRCSGFILPLDTPAYVCLAFYLTPSDLEEIRGDLRPHDKDLPNLGDVGRYRAVPVFPAEEWQREDGPFAYYQGVWFNYLPCLAVD